MNIVKLYQAGESSVRITIPISVARFLGWTGGDKLMVDLDVKNKQVIIKRLEDVKIV